MPLFLPRLKVNRLTPALKGHHGKWVGDDGLLKSISEDLATGSSATDEDIINSIATMFARPWLFAQALFNKENSGSLHQRSLGEWRGLAAVVCFASAYGLDLQLTRFTIPRPSDTLPEQDRIFLTLLSNQIPAGSEAEEWRTMWLISVRNRLLGATSPLSLFYTGVECDCGDIIQWTRSIGGSRQVLTDPTPMFTDSKRFRDLACLLGWLRLVRTDMEGMNRELQARLRNHLFDPWIKQLAAIPQVADLLVKVELHDSLIEESAMAPLLRAFMRPAKMESNDSDVRLQPTVLGAPQPLVLTQSVLQSNTVILGHHYGNTLQLPAQEAEGTEIVSSTGHYLSHPWICPERLFFSEFLLRLPLTSNTYNEQFSPGYSMPLTAAFFRYFTPEEVIRVQLTTLDNGDVTASIRLPVQGRLAQILISKTYPKDRVITLLTQPILDVWPNFQSPQWELYYLYFSAWGQKSLDNFSFQPAEDFDAHDLSVTEENEQTGNSTSREVWQFKTCPQRIVCLYGGKSAGMIVIKPPRSVPVGGDRWDVGLDFGTSNSNVYYSAGADQDRLPGALAFKDRVRPLCQPDNQTRQRNLMQFFLPVGKDLTPDFPTLFLLLNSAKRNSSVLHGIAYFAPDLSDWLKVLKNLHTNMKWASDARERLLISLYIEHLMVLILAEATAEGVGELKVHWSYPSVFASDWLEATRAFWITFPNLPLFSRCGHIKLSASNGTTESLASARYFATTNDVAIAGDAPTVCIDIGGGSTDIAVWCKNRLLLQTSIKLGANDVLVAYAKSHPKFVEALREKLGVYTDLADDEKDRPANGKPREKPLEKIVRLQPEAVPAIINGMFQAEQSHQKLVEFLHSKGGAVDPEFKPVRTVILVATSGLLYFVGLLLRNLNATQAAAKHYTQATICLGGKASRMVEWVQPFIQSSYQELLSGFVAKGVGELPGTNVANFQTTLRLSEHPKQEVVRGLIGPSNLAGQVQHTTLVAENDFELDGIPLDWNQVLTLQDYQRMEPKEKAEFGRFDTYLNHLKRQHTRDLDLTSLVPKNMRQDLMKEVHKIATGSDNAIIQPVFILELKLLLEHCMRVKSKDTPANLPLASREG